MISVEEARGRILAGLRATPAEIVPLAEAGLRVLAAPVAARRTQPPADVSAMDGYALRAADARAGMVLRVIGEAPAGHPFAGGVGEGEAVRLYTGSVVPEGADAIVIQEDTERDGARVTIREAASAGRHIRRRGQDFSEGDTLLPAGRRLSPRDIGLAAAADHPWLAVHRRPRVAILATGDEIALPGEPVPPGGIVSSNAHALAALVSAAGGVPTVLAIARDTADAIAAAADAASGADLLVTSGGASVGDYDLLQAGLGPRGLAVDFWTVAMRPGKPLMFGTLGALPVLGLPGNPVSALVCGLLFVLPALRRLAGLPDAAPARARARLGAAMGQNDRREDYVRARLEVRPDGALVATPFERQDSSMLRLLAQADALIVRPPHAPPATAGAEVEVLRLDGAAI
jgi:molybdopterin molybdotransferase